MFQYCQEAVPYGSTEVGDGYSVFHMPTRGPNVSAHPVVTLFFLIFFFFLPSAFPKTKFAAALKQHKVIKEASLFIGGSWNQWLKDRGIPQSRTTSQIEKKNK